MKSPQLKLSQLTFALLIALNISAAHASAVPLIGAELASFSVLAGGYATYGAGAVISGGVGGVSYVTGGAGSSSLGQMINTPTVTAALAELTTAQSALAAMGTGTVLSPTMSGAVTLAPGVYSASALTTAAGTAITLDGGGAHNPTWVFNIDTYLVTGAATKVVIANAGANASVFWNTGGYTTLGANTDFIGAILSSAYIAEGAGTTVSCGNAFAASYISVPADAQLKSSDCTGSSTWAGSPNGLASGLAIVGGIATSFTAPAGGSTDTVAVPEPQTAALFFGGLVLMGMAMFRRKDKKSL
jgi:hypothetical protein